MGSDRLDLGGVQVAGSLALMLYFSWQLTLGIIALVIPLILIVWSLQGRLSAAYDTARTRVGEMLSEVSESVMGAAVVRAYGLDESTFHRVRGAIDRRYRAEVVAHFRAATLFPLSTVFYAMAVSVVIVLGASFGPEWGLTFGTVTAFLFLADQFLHVFTDLPEIYSETQTAIAGWRKVLAVLDLPIEIEEPSRAWTCPPAPCRSPRRAWSTPTARAAPCCTGSRSTCRRGSTWRSWARRAAARPRS